MHEKMRMERGKVERRGDPAPLASLSTHRRFRRMMDASFSGPNSAASRRRWAGVSGSSAQAGPGSPHAARRAEAAAPRGGGPDRASVDGGWPSGGKGRGPGAKRTEGRRRVVARAGECVAAGWWVGWGG